MGLVLVVYSLLMFVLSEAFVGRFNRKDDRKGIPDARLLKLKVSRGSGTGVISFGFAVVVLIAFALFVLVMVLIIFYKREKGIRNREQTLFLIPY